MRWLGLLVLAAGVGSTIAPRAARADGKDLDGVVNLNTAAPDVLELLPGIGPAKVHSILWYRQRHPFRTVDELVRIKGIGRKMVRRLRAHLAVNGPTTARAVRRQLSFDPPPPLPSPVVPARKPSGPQTAPKKVTGTVAVATRPMARPLAPAAGHGRPPPAPAAGRDRRSRANHCPRPP